MATLLKRCDQFAMLESANVFVVRWYKAPTIAALNEVEVEMDRSLLRHPKSVGWLALSCEQNPTEPEFSKAASQQVARMKTKGLLAIAAVQDDDTLGGKLARITMQVISTFSRGVNVRLFRNQHEACTWLATAVGGVNAATLEDDLRLL